MRRSSWIPRVSGDTRCSADSPGPARRTRWGVILEQLLLHTLLRIVVIDPNGDFVGLREPAHPETLDAQTRHAYARLFDRIRVFTNNDPASKRLTIRGIDLDPDSVAALLRLDPLADREEYSLTTTLLDAARQGATFWESLEQGVAQDVPGATALLQRMRNLGLDRWRVWSPEHSCLDTLFEDARCLVLDVGSLEHPEERNLVALAVLRSLWKGRHRREPVLIVVDEAHNISPAVPDTRLSLLCTEEVVRIAGEGRKFGLYLLLATQRPGKLHPNILSQCENLVLMRMNSRADLDYVATMFSQVPSGLLQQASTFTQGEALAAGWVVPHPVFVRFGGRISREGGADIPPTWAETAVI